MKNNILQHLSQPRELEALYRSNKTQFKESFTAMYDDIRHSPIAQAWYERLTFERRELNWGTAFEWRVVILLCLVAGAIAKLPDFFGWQPEQYYPRNISFIAVPALMAFFSWKHRLPLKQLLITAGVLLTSVVYINLLPGTHTSDTWILACIHLPLVMWSLLGYVFTGPHLRNHLQRIQFLRYTGDVLVMSALLVLSGGLLTAITFGLFQAIGVDIEFIFSHYIILWAAASVPVVATFMVYLHPPLVRNISPVIARVFTPIVLVMLLIYLGTIVAAGKDPYTDREFLMVFNAMLVGVMALIFFNVSELSGATAKKSTTTILLLLAIVTLLINGIALSAIVFRISEMGLTPNRCAVLGSNLIMFIHLMRIAYSLFRLTRTPESTPTVEHRISQYLPIYSVWAMVVVFIFPWIFR